MAKVVGALGGWEVVEEAADAVPRAFSGALAGAAEQAFELGEHLLDRVQVWGVGWQEQERGSGGLDQGATSALLWLDRLSRMTTSGRQLGQEILADILGEDGPVHRLVDHEGSDDAVAGETGEEGGHLPVSGRCVALTRLPRGARP